jgi:hypothetical protein
MATDIFEPEMKATRNARWDKVFHSSVEKPSEDTEFRNLKATIVIEHIVSVFLAFCSRIILFCCPLKELLVRKRGAIHLLLNFLNPCVSHSLVPLLNRTDPSS